MVSFILVRTNPLHTLLIHFILSILSHIHISEASIPSFSLFPKIYVSYPYNIPIHTYHFTNLFLISRSIILKNRNISRIQLTYCHFGAPPSRSPMIPALSIAVYIKNKKQKDPLIFPEKLINLL